MAKDRGKKKLRSLFVDTSSSHRHKSSPNYHKHWSNFLFLHLGSLTVNQLFLLPGNVDIWKISKDLSHLSNPDKSNRNKFCCHVLYTFKTRVYLATLAHLRFVAKYRWSRPKTMFSHLTSACSSITKKQALWSMCFVREKNLAYFPIPSKIKFSYIYHYRIASLRNPA